MAGGRSSPGPFAPARRSLRTTRERPDRREPAIATASEPTATTPAAFSAGTRAAAAGPQNPPAQMTVDPEYAAAIAADPDVRNAFAFNERFRPRDDTDYAWVVRHAKDRYAAADAAMKYVDDKAAAIVTYLGSGAGLLTLASAAAAASNQIDPKVAAAVVPSFAAAALSLAFAAIARKPTAVPTMPTAAYAAGHADAAGEPNRSEAALLGGWEIAAAMTTAATTRKAGWVSRSTWSFVAAVGLLILPLAVSIAIRTPPP